VTAGSTSQLALRISALALVATLLEIVAVSQVSIFGVSADLTPLVVMSIGLLTGSLGGAAVGFGVGLFLDLALVQTLGVNSLIYIAVGYGAGRLRELRDPQGALVPIAAGAAATAIATIGYSVVQFLLGVDAPVSLLLVRDIVTTIIINTILAAPVFALVRRWLMPSLPDDPHRRRRRAYTTGGLSPLSRA
jgi:rod shape-determining protein MreD